MKILNFGSLNIDYTYQVDHFVRPGETEASFSRMTACGGKGLNQSIALAKSGSHVFHAGAVGKTDGGILLDALKNAGVNTDYVLQLEDTPSGSAFIQVNPEGENCIVLDGGANQAITRSRELMDGHKWQLFVLSLTFIGWEILGVLCFGIGLLWVTPYKNAAYAAFYRQLVPVQNHISE